jgi:hypothetical protein
MGDGVLAYFGYPAAHEDEAERAELAGLALRDAVARLSTPSSGPFASQEHSVVGDTPNLATRLQVIAKPGQVGVNAAIRLCRGLAEDRAWARRDRELQVELGRAPIANRGYQAPATMAALERALTLAETAGESSLIVPSVFGLWASRYIAGSPSADLDDSGPRCVAMRMLALEQFPRRGLRVFARAGRTRAVNMRPGDPRASGDAVASRPQGRRRQLQGVEPLASGISRPGPRHCRRGLVPCDRNRTSEHDGSRLLLWGDVDEHLAPRRGAGGGGRARRASTGGGEVARPVERLGADPSRMGHVWTPITPIQGALLGSDAVLVQTVTRRRAALRAGDRDLRGRTFGASRV